MSQSLPPPHPPEHSAAQPALMPANGVVEAKVVDASATDEGGLRAPPGLSPWRKFWWWFDFLILVKLARLRFIAVLVVIGLAITQWDTLAAYYRKWTRLAESDEVSGEFEYYCGMHPSIVRDNNKEKCPVCFMPLTKRHKADANAEAESLPPGVVNRVQLSPYRVALAGAETWRVEYIPLAKEIVAVGYIEFNERGERQVASRITGRIDRLRVAETGQMVEAGDVLAEIYSPELIVTVENVIRTRNTDPVSYQAARRRLELWGIDDAQVEKALASGKAPSHLEIRAPIGGHVIRKFVREGQYVDVGTPLYDLADLSTVWIAGQVYEDDLAFLPPGLVHPGRGVQTESIAVTATTRAYPNEAFRGKLAFVFPHVDQQTRTVTVRFEVDNPGHKLRPGSTATVHIKVPPKRLEMFSPPAANAREKETGDAPKGDDQDGLRAEMLADGRVLAVPQSSVIDTGAQQIVYRQSLPGVYEGVLVQLGPRMVDEHGLFFFPVLGGLDQGDLVVTAGSFLVDAETRLNPAAGSIYFGGSGVKGSGKSATTVRPSTPEDADAKIRAALAKLSEADRSLAAAQKFCPILQTSLLGSMGVPRKIMLDGQAVFLCCSGCEKQAKANPQATLAQVALLKKRNAEGRSPKATDVPPAKPQSKAALKPDEEAEIATALAKLSPADRRLAEAQRFCIVESDNRLGSMGAPRKVMIGGEPVFLCCEGCEEEAKRDPKATLAKLKQLKAANQPTPPK